MWSIVVQVYILIVIATVIVLSFCEKLFDDVPMIWVSILLLSIILMAAVILNVIAFFLIVI